VTSVACDRKTSRAIACRHTKAKANATRSSLFDGGWRKFRPEGILKAGESRQEGGLCLNVVTSRIVSLLHKTSLRHTWKKLECDW
jgi:hypothetical protein